MMSELVVGQRVYVGSDKIEGVIFKVRPLVASLERGLSYEYDYVCAEEGCEVMFEDGSILWIDISFLYDYDTEHKVDTDKGGITNERIIKGKI